MERFSDIRGIQNIRMNLDSSDELLKPNEFREIYNMLDYAGEGKLSNLRGLENVLTMPVNASFGFDKKKYVFTLIDAGQFSGDNFSFYIITSAGMYSFNSRVLPTSTDYSLFVGLLMLPPTSGSWTNDFDTPYFTLSFTDGRITIVPKAPISFITSDFGDDAMILSTVSEFSQDFSDYKCVGTDNDIEGNAIDYMLCDTVGMNHCIVRLNVETKELMWILKEEPLLNFKADHPVSADTIEGLKYFTDGYFGSFLNNDFNPPRKINVSKAIAYTAAKETAWKFTGAVRVAVTLNGETVYYTGFTSADSYPFELGDKVVSWSMDTNQPWNRNKKLTGYGEVYHASTFTTGYIVVTTRVWTDTETSRSAAGYIMPYAPGQYFGIDWQVMDRIKYPPAFAPTAEYGSDTSVKSNNLRNDLFQFAYRWVYDDNEKSVFSPKSEIPMPTSIQLFDGTYDIDPTIDNNIVVWQDSGSMEVTAVELAVRKGNSGNWVIIGRSNKYDQNNDVIFTNDIYLRFDFYNTELGETIDQIDGNRPYDAVPLVSEYQEIIEKNRLIDANYKEGFDNLEIDVSLTNVQTTPEIAKSGIVSEIFRYFTIFPISGSTYFVNFYGGVIDFTDIYEPGFTYIVSIEAFPYQYINVGEYEEPPWPLSDIYGEFWGKTIVSQATVIASDQTTFADFSDEVVAKLRTGDSASNRVIGINNFSYKGFNGMVGFAHINSNYTTSPFVTDNDIGFIIEYTAGDAGFDAIVAPNLHIKVTKLSNFTIQQTFTSGAIHPFGLFYIDRAGRFGSVNKSAESQIYIPSQVENSTKHELYKNTVSWEINHIPPVWATHYVWAYAKNSSTSYSLYATIAKIDTVDASQTVFLSINKYVVNQQEYVKKFNIPAYTWEPGDRIRFIAKSDGVKYYTIPFNLDFEIVGVADPVDYDVSGNTYEKNDLGEFVKDAAGNKIKDFRQNGILIPSFNYQFFNISINDTVVEIYRPKKTTDAVVFYEFENIFPINNPHTVSRSHGSGYKGTDQIVENSISYSPATGTFKGGDAYLRYRIMINAFPCETFLYSDYFSSDVISIGTINAVVSASRFTTYISRLLYSGKLIQNTRVNDLSRVDASDSIELADKYGAINHIEEVGDTLKVLQKSKPSSLLIGRAGVTQPNEEGSQIISSTKDVLGTLIVTRWDYGTVHGKSVVKYANRHAWFDFYAQAILRDPGNGIQDLTEIYGLKKFMQQACEKFGTSDNVEVCSGYDQSNELVIFTFNDKTTAANSFTLAFRDTGGRTEDGFVMFAGFMPDIYGMSKKVLTSFANGGIWLHNSDNVARCNFYGVQQKYWFTPVFNKLPNTMKRFLQLYITSPKKFSAPNAGDISTPISGNSVFGGVSLLKPKAFLAVMGKWVADIGRNMTTNSATPKVSDLINGDDMEGLALTVRLEAEETTEHKVMAVEVQGVTS